MGRVNKGFTLVEILIVVIILGILAAIVIPQYTQASSDAKNSSLSADLQTFRSQCELYKFQHNNNYPWQQAGVTTDAAFWAQMMSKTNIDGTTTGTPTIGPYLQSKSTNQFGTTGNTQNVSFGTTAVPGNGTSAWYVNTTINKVSPNDAQGHSGL